MYNYSNIEQYIYNNVYKVIPQQKPGDNKDSYQRSTMINQIKYYVTYASIVYIYPTLELNPVFSRNSDNLVI